MPRRRRLTDAGIARLRPEPREYTVWDTRVRGLGVRVRSSGARTYVHHRPSSAGVRKVSLGPATARGIEEVRRTCLAAAAAVEATPAVRNDAPRFGEFVAGPWKSACYNRFTPSTQRSMRSALRSRLLPAFGAVRIDRICRVTVVRWFDAYSRTAPGGANRGLDVLRKILDHAIACGHIATNPARAIRRNPRAKLTRFLSREEIRRLHRVLDDHAVRSASARQQVDIIRLLLLTGCRKSEIVRLRWQEVDGDRLNLRAAKTGPRRVFLNAQARAIVERRREQADSPWVFPSVRNPTRPRGDELALWYCVRREAGLEEVRLHDLRHSVASHAVMLGVPLPVVARLLGHRQPSMTLRYAHVGDREIEAAAERVGQTISRLMAGSRPVTTNDAKTNQGEKSCRDRSPLDGKAEWIAQRGIRRMFSG